MRPILIGDLHRPYLQVQHGKVANFIGQGPDVWDEEYNKSIYQIFDTFSKFIPTHCPINVLDVGSGLGGIDILIRRTNTDAALHLLDGLDDKPIVEKHRKTFSNAVVAYDFMRHNDITHSIGCIDPHQAQYTPEIYDGLNFDLVVSFASYCFHYEPSTYLEFIDKTTRSGSILILDVRENRPEWVGEISSKFGRPVSILEVKPKYVRYLWRKP